MLYLKNGKNKNSSSIYLKKFTSNSILPPKLKNNSVDFIKTEEKEEIENVQNKCKKNKSYSKLNTNIKI